MGLLLNTQKPIMATQLSLGHWSTKDLAGCWVMNEGVGGKVFDLSGNGNTGTVHSDTSWVPAKFGSGLDFDGVNNGRIEILPMAQMNKNTLTVIVWMFSRSDGENNLGRVWNWQGGTEFVTSADTRFYFEADFDNTNGRWTGDPGTLLQNQWAMYVITYDGSSVNNNPMICVNGVDKSSDFVEAITPVGNFIQPSTKNFWVGTNYNSAVTEIDGIIDNMLIYNRILTADEIALLYREPFIMFERDPIELWTAASAVAGVTIPIMTYHYKQAGGL